MILFYMNNLIEWNEYRRVVCTFCTFQVALVAALPLPAPLPTLKSEASWK